MARSPNITVPDQETIAWLRTKTPAEKLQMMSDLHRIAQQILAAEIQQEHPYWSYEQVQEKVAWRIFNKKLICQI